MPRSEWAEEEIKKMLEEIRSRTMKTEASEPPIKEICERITKGRLELQADFQRQYVWGNKSQLKSKLIESVLLRVPIPVIYTAELESGKDVVVDGQQRLKTFYEFRQTDGFRLKGLDILAFWNGSKYADLPSEIQDSIDSYPLRVVRLLKDTFSDVKYDVFERLNRGSVPLNDQEIRNCIYRGNFNDLLKDLAVYSIFQRIQGLDEPHPRMKDIERVLRFFAFSDRGIQNYSAKIRTFLNLYMEEKRELSEEVLSKKGELFKKCVDMCDTVFGDLNTAP